MAEHLIFNNGIPWWHIGHTYSNNNPFATSGIDWCTRCRSEVDTDCAGIQQNDTFTFKRWCAKCGKVISWGIYNQCLMLSNTPLPPAAVEWTVTPGKDKS